MSRGKIIKSSDAQGVAPISLNLSDASKLADHQVRTAAEQADQLRSKAEQDAKSAYEAAQQAGFKAGYEAGMNEAERLARSQFEQAVTKQVDERLSSLTPLFQRLMEQVQTQQQNWLAHWEHRIGRFAIQVAGKIARKEIGQDQASVERLLKEVVRMVGEVPTLQVSVHPNDHQVLSANTPLLVELAKREPDLQLLADPSIEPGGCVLRSDFGTIDASIATQIDRIQEELFPAEEEAAGNTVT